jgi:hypothetical protein
MLFPISTKRTVIRLKDGDLAPLRIGIQGLQVPVLSVHCAVAAVLGIILPYGRCEGKADDYTHALENFP